MNKPATDLILKTMIFMNGPSPICPSGDNSRDDLLRSFSLSNTMTSPYQQSFPCIDKTTIQFRKSSHLVQWTVSDPQWSLEVPLASPTFCCCSWPPRWSSPRRKPFSPSSRTSLRSVRRSGAPDMRTVWPSTGGGAVFLTGIDNRLSME